MSHGSITLPFGNGEYDFNVARHKQLFELQDKCGLRGETPEGAIVLIPSGPNEIFNRLRNQRWRECDVREPLRLGLIGAGRSASEVEKLMKEFVDDQPLAPLAALSARVVFAACFGVQGDDVGKKKAEGTLSEEKISTSSAPQPTEPELPSVSLPER
jgi:Protein of unknown function (DUF3356).